jgi:16S rRNA (guanine(1405)-N(7))-methyltransferase
LQLTLAKDIKIKNTKIKIFDALKVFKYRYETNKFKSRKRYSFKMIIKVNGLAIKNSYLKEIVKAIKAKKELSYLLDSTIINEIKSFSYTNYSKLKKAMSKADSVCEFTKSSYFKDCIKFCRARLRKKAGLYLKSKDDKRIFEVSKLEDNEVKKILLAHKSSFERYSYYPEIYNKIFQKLKKNPSRLQNIVTILDLGCGLNPLSYLFFDEKLFKSSNYLAIDIDKRALEIVNIFFKQKGLNGKTFHMDVLELITQKSSKGQMAKKEIILQKINDFSCDLALMFKLLELIEKKGHKNSEKLITSLNAKMIVASFPKKTISGKSMKVTKKPWLERMLTRLSYEFETFEIPTEIFYLIYKP